MAKQSELSRAVAHLDEQIASLMAARAALLAIPQPKRKPKPAKVAAISDRLAADGR